MTADNRQRALADLLDAPADDLAQDLLQRALALLGPDQEAGSAVLENLLSDPRETVRANALVLIHRLGQRSRNPGPALAAFRETALGTAAADASSLVRAAAATMLVSLAGDRDIPRLRTLLHSCQTDLERHANMRGASRALNTLRGGRGTVELLNAAMATEGGGVLPDDILAMLADLERNPLAEAATPLAQLFTRVPAVREKLDPERLTLDGVGHAWDPQTTLALATLRALLACVPAADAGKAVRLMRVVHKPLLAVIIADLPALGERGGRLAAELAVQHTLDLALRMACLDSLADLARRGGDTGANAARVLDALRDDPSLGQRARALRASIP